MTLTEQHEQIATDLAQLLASWHVRAEAAELTEVAIPEPEQAAVKQAARVFGEQLNAEGGFELMQAVGRRATDLAGTFRYLDFWWCGIGRWAA